MRWRQWRLRIWIGLIIWVRAIVLGSLLVPSGVDECFSVSAALVVVATWSSQPSESVLEVAGASDSHGRAGTNKIVSTSCRSRSTLARTQTDSRLRQELRREEYSRTMAAITGPAPVCVGGLIWTGARERDWPIEGKFPAGPPLECSQRSDPVRVLFVALAACRCARLFLCLPGQIDCVWRASRSIDSQLGCIVRAATSWRDGARQTHGERAPR